MILYLSSATEQNLFEEYQKQGIVNCGFQAQKFNYLVITGIEKYSEIIAIGNLPYANTGKNYQTERRIVGNCNYICLGNNAGRLHKLLNLKNMMKEAITVFKEHKITGIVCDAINPLASLVALYCAKRYKVKAAAIVTDLPYFMDEGRISFFTRLTQYLMCHYDRYILLTEAMNEKINPRKKPYIVMEGLCDVSNDVSKEEVRKGKSFVYTGSLSFGTGLEQMMDGFVKADLKNIYLDIYGRGEMEQYIKDYSKSHPLVRYMGAVSNSEVLRYQKSALLLVNPRPLNIGYVEYSFPSKVMEYMASGSPVLTTRLPGIPEEYFKYVYEIDGDTESFAETLTKIAKTPEQELIDKGSKSKCFVLEKKNKYYQAGRIMDLINRN